MEMERIDMWTHGAGGEGGTNWEISMKIQTLPCVKQITSENLLYSTENSAPCTQSFLFPALGNREHFTFLFIIRKSIIWKCNSTYII